MVVFYTNFTGVLPRNDLIPSDGRIDYRPWKGGDIIVVASAAEKYRPLEKTNKNLGDDNLFERRNGSCATLSTVQTDTLAMNMMKRSV